MSVALPLTIQSDPVVTSTMMKRKSGEHKRRRLLVRLMRNLFATTLFSNRRRETEYEMS